MTLVLLHAFPLDGRMWEPLARDDAIAPRLYRPGSTMDEWAAGVLEQVEGPFLACGASMGGYCALALARRAPDRLTGLVLAGARIEADSPERRAGRADTIELIRSRGPSGLWEDMRPKLFPETAPAAVVEQARGIALEQDADELVRGVEAIRDRTDSASVVARLGIPLVMAVGEHDPFLSVEEARATGGRLHVFEGAGHLPAMERPAEFNRLLDSVL
ncbi:MAG: alpha/beta fold hydrolase [Actinobacteria bacterium]|nr:alpha/beta fold hydrolase [Actinomycetota bacterium]